MGILCLLTSIIFLTGSTTKVAWLIYFWYTNCCCQTVVKAEMFIESVLSTVRADE